MGAAMHVVVMHAQTQRVQMGGSLLVQAWLLFHCGSRQWLAGRVMLKTHTACTQNPVQHLRNRKCSTIKRLVNCATVWGW